MAGDDQIETSIIEYKKALVKNPGNAPVHLQLSYAFTKKGEQEQENAFYLLALEEARQALKHNQDTDEKVGRQIHQQLINLYNKCDQLDVAITEYKKLSKEDPNNKIYKDCLKQIVTISSLKVTPGEMNESSSRGKVIVWIFLFLVGAEILFGIFKSPKHIFIGVSILIIYFFYRLFCYLRIKSKHGNF